MKILRVLIATGVVTALVIGCSTIQERQSMLSAAGTRGEWMS